jgi:hypothetical protein
MLTPAIKESSTSSPLTIRWYASSTQVRGPPFRYWLPLAEEMTTGGVARRTSTVGAWPRAAAGTVATTDAAVPAFTKSRRLIFPRIGSLPRSPGGSAVARRGRGSSG